LFTFSFVFTFTYTQKSIKISLALLFMQKWINDHIGHLALRIFLHHLIYLSHLRLNLLLGKQIMWIVLKGIPRDDPIAHLKRFVKRCDTLKINISLLTSG
jgi:hypothetical protein